MAYLSDRSFISDDIKLHLRDELTPARNRGFYLCPLCGSGEKHNHTGAVKLSEDGKLWNCFSCGEGGDIVTLIEKRDGLSKAEARQYLLDKYAGLPTRPYAATRDTTTAAPSNEAIRKKVSAAADAFAGSPAENYMQLRGITAETCREYRIGYFDGSGRSQGSVVIPYPGQDYYISRALDKSAVNKYYKPRGISEPPFIAGDRHAEVVYICEGQIDALSLWQAGARYVIAVGGAGLSKLDVITLPHKVVIVADNDDPGERTAEKAKAYIDQRGALAYIVHPPKEDKDVNDTLRRDPGQLAALVNAWTAQIIQESQPLPKNDPVEGPYSPANEKDDNLPVEEAKAPKTATERARDQINKFIAHIESDKYKPHATGLKFFDDLIGGGLLNQTIVQIMAAPGAGKTTLCMQLAETMTDHGTPVLYVSLEMSEDQMIAKAISYRLTQAGHPVTATRILQGYNWTDEDRARIPAELANYVARPLPVEYFHDRDGYFTRVMAHITARAEEAKAAKQPAPVVILDYLHLLRSEDRRDDDQALLKGATKALKDFAIDYNTCVIFIAAINRESMKEGGEININSGRDSSGLEFTADQVITLDFDWPVKSNGKRDTSKTAKRELQKEHYRRHILELEKNRHGPVYDPVKVYYYAAGNTFYAESDPAIKDVSDKYKKPFGHNPLKTFSPAKKTDSDTFTKHFN